MRRSGAALARDQNEAPLGFEEAVAAVDPRGLRRGRVTTLQVNTGKLCNMACHHCHVGAGPKRTEIMPRHVAHRVIELLASNPAVDTLDLNRYAHRWDAAARHRRLA